jgi:hypothetical protein
MEIIDPRTTTVTVTEEDVAKCSKYLFNATLKGCHDKVVNDRVYTAFEFDLPDGKRRVVLGHPAITYAPLVGTTMTVQYYTGKLGVLDASKGISYFRLALDPTEEEMDAYIERLQREKARREAFEARKQARPKPRTIKYFY